MPTATKVQHTPGPWEIHRNDIADIFDIRVGMHGICDIVNPKQHLTELTIDESEANARLIAAAPELLTAIKFATGFVARHKSKIDGENLHQELLTLLNRFEK